MGKIIGLDIGEVRVGCAVSDEAKIMAFPRGVVLRVPEERFFYALRKLVKDEAVEKIVIGLPLGEENEETPRAEKIRLFADKIAREAGVAVVFVDEYGSTAEARAKIPYRKDRRKKGGDDALAAQIILERYLSRNL